MLIVTLVIINKIDEIKLNLRQKFAAKSIRVNNLLPSLCSCRSENILSKFKSRLPDKNRRILEPK